MYGPYFKVIGCKVKNMWNLHAVIYKKGVVWLLYFSHLTADAVLFQTTDAVQYILGTCGLVSNHTSLVKKKEEVCVSTWFRMFHMFQVALHFPTNRHAVVSLSQFTELSLSFMVLS